jgi:Putative peptidoglycan binding domain
VAFNPQLHPRAGKGPGGGRFITAKSNPQQDKAAKGAKRKLGGSLDTARIRSFQRQHGLVVDGVIGRQTAAALLGNPRAKAIPTGRLTPKQEAALKKFADLPKTSQVGQTKSQTARSGSSSTRRRRKSSTSTRASQRRRKDGLMQSLDAFKPGQ